MQQRSPQVTHNAKKTRLASKLEEALSQRAAAHWNFFTAGLFIGAVGVAGVFAGVGFGERFRSKYNAVSRSARCYSFRIEEKLEGDEVREKKPVKFNKLSNVLYYVGTSPA